ncbi:MAG: DNA glycosylase [Lachnospiraceae bacterium]|nr:DNA glycosylase [Lachnospiraceae bacterium]MBR5789450.1 DNA glycosylase [Lachnospiraceae bacterium]
MIIDIKDDFDLEKIMNSGQAFRIAKVGNYYRFIHGSEIIYIRNIEGPTYEILGGAFEDYFDMGRNYTKIRGLAAGDSFLKSAVECGRGIRILRQDPFETMISFIISQRKSIPSIKACVEGIARKYGKPIKTEFETVYRFPTPAELAKATEDELRELKTGYRAPYILDAVRRVNSGELDLKKISLLEDAELIEALKTVNGIGDKVANCIGLFAYGRTGLAPVDTWIRKIMDNYYGGENPFVKYGDAAGIMQQYAFFYAVSTKLKL